MPEALPFRRPAARLERRRILSDTSVRSLKPPATGRIDYFDDATPGLSLRLTANNVRTWTVFYRDKNGRQKRLSLGRYPAVKLVDARELAREAQRKVAQLSACKEHQSIEWRSQESCRTVMRSGRHEVCGELKALTPLAIDKGLARAEEALELYGWLQSDHPRKTHIFFRCFTSGTPIRRDLEESLRDLGFTQRSEPRERECVGTGPRGRGSQLPPTMEGS